MTTAWAAGPLFTTMLTGLLSNNKTSWGKILQRALLAAARFLLLLLAVTAVAFLLVVHSPNDPVESFVGAGVSLEQQAVIEENWGLNEPVWKRYVIWLEHVFHGDFGQSMAYRQPVATVLGSRVSLTLLLLCSAWLFSGVFGFLLGVISGVYRGSFADRLIRRFSLLMASAPVFWLGLLMIMLFAVRLRWFPMGLAAPAGKLAADVTIGDRIYHLILPAVTLGITGVSKMALHTREKMIDILDSEYMVFARARGEKLWTAIRRHGIRNILLPAVTIQFNSINELFSGSVLAEQVFSYPGLGNAAAIAGLNGDANLLLAVTLVSAIIVFFGNLVAEILYGILDPQIREGRQNES